MNITTIDYLPYVDNASKVFNGKLKWTPDLPANFLEHTLPILASIPLVYEDRLINTTKTLEELKEIKTIETPNGIMTGRNIMRLVMFLYFSKRNLFLSVPQNKNPRLGNLTPLLMYAQKLYNNVNYGKWSKEPGVKYALGHALEPILKVEKLPGDFDLNDTRRIALTYKSGRKEGQMAPLTAYKCNVRRVGGIDYRNIVIIMLLQLWLANASLRDTEAMILDPLDWDNIPPAYDEIIKEEPKEEPAEDISWY
jgi:hypothetical protein